MPNVAPEAEALKEKYDFDVCIVIASKNGNISVGPTEFSPEQFYEIMCKAIGGIFANSENFLSFVKEFPEEAEDE
jgi:hypothetical protein